MITFALIAALAAAQDPLQKSLGDLEAQGPWNYNDPAAGFGEAKRSGKPLLVVFR